MQVIKAIAKDLDLYGTDVLIQALKNSFSHVSYTFNARKIPTCGSICRKTQEITPQKNFKVEKVIFHRNGKVTIYTNHKQYFQFLNI